MGRCRDARTKAARHGQTLLQGRPGFLPKPISDLLIHRLTITGDTMGVEGCVERLHEFKKQGLTQIALSLEGDPAKGIRLIGQKVVSNFRET